MADRKIVRSLYMQSSRWKSIEKVANKMDRSVNWVIENIVKEWIDNTNNKNGGGIQNQKRTSLQHATGQGRNF